LNQSLFKIFKIIRMTWGGNFLNREYDNVVHAWSCVFFLNNVIQFKESYREEEEEEFGMRGLVR